MRKPAIAAIAAVFTLTATAQQPQPLQCANPDILNSIVFNGLSDRKMEVTRGLPAFMSGFRTPGDFSLIGSGLYEDGQATIIAYKTQLAGDKAHAAMVVALGSEGWAVEATQGPVQTFNVAGAPREATLCRNGEERGLRVWDAAGARYVNIFAVAGLRGAGCGAPSFVDMGRGGPVVLPPRFQFPAGTSLAQGVGGGSGGSNRLYSTSTRIISGETSPLLVAHLASQLQGQGWRPDAEWSAAGSAGSTWRKIVGEQLMWGTLEIIRVSEGTYDVEFTQALPQ